MALAQKLFAQTPMINLVRVSTNDYVDEKISDKLLVDDWYYGVKNIL